MDEFRTLVMRKPSTSSTFFIKSCVKGRACGEWHGGGDAVTSRTGRGVLRAPPTAHAPLAGRSHHAGGWAIIEQPAPAQEGLTICLL